MLTEGGPWSGVSYPTVGGHIEIPLRWIIPLSPLNSCHLPDSTVQGVCFKGNTYWMEIVRIKFTLSELLLAHP